MADLRSIFTRGRNRDSVLFTRDDVQRNPQGYMRLLDQCGLLRPITSPEQQAIHNWGVNLLENAGMNADNREHLIQALVSAILKADMPQEFDNERR